MRKIPMIVVTCVLALVGSGALVLGCGTGEDGDGEYETVKTVDGEPSPDEVVKSARATERLPATALLADTQASAAREAPRSMELAVDPDNDFYLSRALEPEPPGTVHIEIWATKP